MGKIKYITRIRELFKKTLIVSINSIKKIVNNKNYTNILINHLVKKQEIIRITKGFYTIHDDPTLAVFCFKPAYIGLQDALSVHNLWEQETIPIIITSKKVRTGIRKISGTNVLIRRINKNLFFGIEYIKQGKYYYPTSNIEKTFIDMIYFKQPLNKDITKRFKKRINIKKLKTYLKKYPKKTSAQILKKLTL